MRMLFAVMEAWMDNLPLPPPAWAGLPLSIEELTAERDAALEELRLLRAAVNRWQMLVQSARGNMARVEQELQLYLRNGRLPEQE